MKSHRSTRLLIGLLAVCAWCVSCDSGGVALLNGGNSPVGTNSGDSVDGGDTGRSSPFDGALSARVRNESSSRVDVTMRFIRDDSVVHLAFVRVPPSTITTVASPEMVELVELSGLDEGGRALDGAVFKYGVDFDERSPAEYLVVDRNAPPVGPGDGPTGPLRLSLVEPEVDTTVTLGSALRVRWDDGGAGPSALVRLFLRPEGNATASSLRALSPAIGAALDGINDEFALLIQDVSAGRYELVAELTDGERTVQSVAPGRVVVQGGAGDRTPRIAITEPKITVDLHADEALSVAWTDEDSDDNATIVFSLEQPQTATATGGSFRIGPPIAEDPDGRSADSLSLSLVGVLPGLYDLVATIDDGTLQGVDRVEQAVRVLPSLFNDPPSLVLLAPARDTNIVAGTSIDVRWSDEDANDDARISFLIDSNWSRVGLGGGERLVVSGVSEDADGSGGSARLTIPANVGAGKYRLIGVITDGMTQVVTRAPGFLFIEGDPTVAVSDGGTDTGTSGGGGDDGGGNDGDGSDQDNVADGGDTGTGDGNDTGGGGDSGGDENNDTGQPDVVVVDGAVEVPGERVTDPIDDLDEQPSVVVVDDDSDSPDPNIVVIDRPEVISDERGTEPVREVVFDIGLVAQSPVIPAGLTLTNEPYGGHVRIELSPPASWRPGGEDSLMQLRIPLSEIPNDAWPRSFDLIVVYLIDGMEQAYVWPRPVQIPQLVEVAYAGLSGACSTPSQLWVGPQRFQGLAVGWYGGGVTETSGRAQVEFWLSGDGLAPADGREDSTHRLVFAGLGSPNSYSESLVDLATVVLGGVAALNPREFDRAYGLGRDGGNRHTLIPGEYSILTVVDYGEFGRVVTRPDIEPVNVCASAVQVILNN